MSKNNKAPEVAAVPKFKFVAQRVYFNHDGERRKLGEVVEVEAGGKEFDLVLEKGWGKKVKEG